MDSYKELSFFLSKKCLLKYNTCIFLNHKHHFSALAKARADSTGSPGVDGVA